MLAGRTVRCERREVGPLRVNEGDDRRKTRPVTSRERTAYRMAGVRAAHRVPEDVVEQREVRVRTLAERIHGVYARFCCAAASAFFGFTSVRRPSAVLSAVDTMISITCGGVSAGLTARILPARLATCGEAIDVPDSAMRAPPGK